MYTTVINVVIKEQDRDPLVRVGDPNSVPKLTDLETLLLTDFFTVGVIKIAPSSKNVRNFADFLWWFGMPAFNDNDVH
jgi:hypothetical protein